MRVLLGLDPGRQGFGWALLTDGLLTSAGVVCPPRGSRLTIHAAAARVIKALPCPRSYPTECVIERMVHYPPPRGIAMSQASIARSTAVANDLLDLQAIGGLVAGAMCEGPIHYRTPREWKGTTPTTAIETRLSWRFNWRDCERAVWAAVLARGKTTRHNAVDAIALSLGHEGRLRLT